MRQKSLNDMDGRLIKLSGLSELNESPSIPEGLHESLHLLALSLDLDLGLELPEGIVQVHS